jgi:hypothetical protein
MANDGRLCKTLFYDISHQAWVPAAIALVDASNCHNWIAHTMASLIFQAFGVPLTAVKTMLGTIENMKIFLQTGFGNSKTFAGGGIGIKTQGLTQGNGASPAGWVVISICILGAHRKRGTVPSSTVPSLNCNTTFQLFCMSTIQISSTSTSQRMRVLTRYTAQSSLASTAGGTFLSPPAEYCS